MAELNYQVDAIVCSGGISENDTEILRRIFKGFSNVGIELSVKDGEAVNNRISYTPVFVLPASEELAMAKAVMEKLEK